MADELRDALEAACNAWPEATALVDTTGSLRYRDFAAEAGKIEQQLRAACITPSEPVVVLVSNTARDFCSFFGVWRAGGVVVAAHRAAPAAVLGATLARSGARFVVDPAQLTATTRGSAPPPKALLSGAAFIVSTSGSTGVPKGVVLSQSAFAAKLHAIDSLLDFTFGSSTALVLQITFSFGLWVSLLTLIKGGTLYMQPKFEPHATFDLIGRHGIARLAVVPTMLRSVFAALDAGDRELLRTTLARAGALRQVLTGGESLVPALAVRTAQTFAGAELTDIYGLTETCTSDFMLQPSDRDRFPGSIGRPTPGVAYRINAGELQIRSAYSMTGYLDAPALTGAAYDNGYFKTGDLAREADGVVYLQGRAKDIISRGGNKISPLEVEAAFADHPNIAAVLATGIDDALTGERIHLLVVPRHGQHPDEADLRRYGAERLEKFKRPDVIHFGEHVPLGPTGKADRGELRRLLEAR